MTDLRLSRAQYASLIKSIEESLRKHVSGGGGDFTPPDMVPYIHDMSFFVQDDRFEGGGFFSSIGKAFKKVYGALKSSGVIDKAKDAALKKGRELGGKAIDAAAKKVESEASKRGLDVSKITQAAASKAHEHLHEAEGHLAKRLDQGQSALEKRAGISGSGHSRMHGKGHGKTHFRGGDMFEMGGNGMYQMQGRGDAFAPQTFIRAPTSYPVPRSAMQVSSTHHLM